MQFMSDSWNCAFDSPLSTQSLVKLHTYILVYELMLGDIRLCDIHKSEHNKFIVIYKKRKKENLEELTLTNIEKLN